MFLSLVLVWGRDFDQDLILDFIKEFKGPIIIDADAISMFKNNKRNLYTIF